MRIFLVTTLFLLAANALSAQIYKGTIGNLPVYLNVDYDMDGEISGVYFYESQTIDIPFAGNVKDNRIIFRAGPESLNAEDRELFQLLRIGETMRGTWKHDGKELDVSLKAIYVSELPHPYAVNPLFSSYLQPDFETVRTSLAKFIPTDSVTKLKNGITLTWYKESHWDSKLFRIAKGLPDSTMKWVNYQLELLQLLSFSGHGTSGIAPDGHPNEFTTEISDYFVNTDFFSIELTDVHEDGETHPEFSVTEINLDLKNTKRC